MSGWGRMIEVNFAPREIVTYRVPRAEGRPVLKTNLLAWEEGDQARTASDLTVGRHELIGDRHPGGRT